MAVRVSDEAIGDDADPDVEFGKLITPERVARWQRGAKFVEMELHEFVFESLDAAAEQLLRSAARTI